MVLYFKNLKYLVLTGVITGLLFALSMLTIWVDVGGSNKFQIADGLFLVLCIFIPGPMVLVSGIIFSFLFDIFSGGLVFIPVTILIRIAMFTTLKLFQRFKKPKINYLAIPIAAALVLCYFPYNYWLFNLEVAFTGLISDGLQCGVSILVAEVLYFLLNKSKLRGYFTNLQVKETNKTMGQQSNADH